MMEQLGSPGPLSSSHLLGCCFSKSSHKPWWVRLSMGTDGNTPLATLYLLMRMQTIALVPWGPEHLDEYGTVGGDLGSLSK